jgi:hypothetical protein
MLWDFRGQLSSFSYVDFAARPVFWHNPIQDPELSVI